MTEKLGWIVAGVLAALIVGFLLGRRHGSTEAQPPPAPMPMPDQAPAAMPGPDAIQAAPPSDDMPRRGSSVPPPAPAGHLPAGVAPAPRPAGGGSFLGGARSPSRGGTQAPPAKAPASSAPPMPTAAPPPARAAAAPAPGRSAGASHGSARAAIAGVRSWGYQLQNVDLRAMAGSPYDLIVIDHSRDGSDEGALKPAEMQRLAQKPDGGRRLVISYISIGEAESYRGYWDDAWKSSAPPFLLAENPEWEENYSVRFWDPAWQAIIFGTPEAYLDRIIAQGFDGVYLDKCDVTEDLRTHFPDVARERPDLERDMVAFVTRLAAHARRTKPGFVIIMQNAEPLLRFPDLRAAIDGVGKEELYFGLDGGEGGNEADAVESSRGMLKLAQAEGKAILLVEYLSSRTRQQQASELAARDGFVLFLSPKDRELASLGTGPIVA